MKSTSLEPIRTLPIKTEGTCSNLRWKNARKGISKLLLLPALLCAPTSVFAALTPTTTTISSATNPSTYGQSVTFTATVTSRNGSPPNGDTVEFLQGANELGTGTLSGGTASLKISTLSAGTDNIKAKYLGDSTFGVSSSSAVAQVVNGASTTTTVSSSQNPANVGQSVTFTAGVTSPSGGTPTGNVSFYKGSTKMGSGTLSGGVATLTTVFNQATTTPVTAVYKGSSAFSTSTSSAITQTVGAGSYIDSTMMFDGITRYYEVFVPTALPAHPPMVFMLHGTRFTDSFTPEAVISLNWGWNTLANLYGFILVKPASTYDASTTQWNWNSYFMDAAFAGTDLGTCTEPPATGCPDDAGFLRQLIVNLSSQYNINPQQVYVTGFSSGAQMSERVGVEISDLVAAIAPVSGQMVGETPPPPVLPGNAVAPISVQEWHGTDDQNLWPCGYGTTNYSGVIYTLDTVDDTFNYWTSQNSCNTLQTTATLCSGSSANSANDAPTPGLTGDTGNIATSCSQSNVEVQFIWEPGVGHSAQPATDDVRWQFFVAHPKPASGGKF